MCVYGRLASTENKEMHEDGSDNKKKKTGYIEDIKLYFKQPVLLASLSYVFMFINTLSPGSVVITYLQYKQLHILLIALFQV